MTCYSRRMLMLIVAAVLLLLVACGPTFPDSETQATLTVPPAIPHRPTVFLQYCGDNTGSYPRQYFLEANRYIADSLDAAVQLNQDGVTAYITLITSSTYNPKDTVLTVTIPATPNNPPAPSLATPTPSGNPFKDGQVRATAAANTGNEEQQYQATLAANQQLLQQVRTQVHTQTNRLRELAPPTENISTSIWGCLDLASQRLAEKAGIKLLVIASDMENNTDQDKTANFIQSHALKGVAVSVIFYYCQVAVECQQKTTSWQQVFLGAGATSVRFVDAGASPTLPPLLQGVTA